MSCPKTEIISAYLDKELAPGERAAFESHLQGCRGCAQRLGELRSLRMAFTRAERHQAPYGFATRVMARTADLKSPSPLSSPQRGEGRVRGWFVPFSIRFAEAAVLLIVITVGILAGRAMTNGPSTRGTTNLASSLSLELFEATPPGSLGGAYLAMTETRNEK